jgi:hypothetical protein
MVQKAKAGSEWPLGALRSDVILRNDGIGSRPAAHPPHSAYK